MRRVPWAVAGLLVLLVTVLWGRVVPGQQTLRSVLHPVARPFDAVTDGVVSRVTSVLQSFLRIAQLARRTKALEVEVAGLRAEEARAESVARENADLRRALDLRPSTPYNVVAADVTGSTTDGATDALRINRGTRHGVARNAPVLAPGGVIVGRVRDAGWTDATVDLLAGGAVRVGVRALSTGAEGVVRGTRGLEAILEGVPRTQELKTGDTLVSTGIDGAFPPHLLVGTIGEIRAPENAVFQEAGVRFPVNARALRIVEILTGS